MEISPISLSKGGFQREGTYKWIATDFFFLEIINYNYIRYL